MSAEDDDLDAVWADTRSTSRGSPTGHSAVRILQCAAIAWRLLGRKADAAVVSAQVDALLELSDAAVDATIRRISPIPECSHPQPAWYNNEASPRCGVCHAFVVRAAVEEMAVVRPRGSPSLADGVNDMFSAALRADADHANRSGESDRRAREALAARQAADAEDGDLLNAVDDGPISINDFIGR